MFGGSFLFVVWHGVDLFDWLGFVCFVFVRVS